MLSILLAICGAGMVLHRAWVTDDAYITLRHVMNVHAGSGPVFNAGERVQGFTHPLWFLLLVAASCFTSVYAAAVACGLALCVGTVGSLAWFLRGRANRGQWLVLAFLCLFSSRTFVEFQTSGLETSLATLLICTLFGWLASRTTDDAPARGPLAWLCVLLVLTRPDYAVLCAPVVLGVLAYGWRQRRIAKSPTHGWTGVVTALLALFAWYGFATIYYGSPLPSTAYAKANMPLMLSLARGLTYARVYIADEPVGGMLMLAGIAAGLAGARSRRLAGWQRVLNAALSLSLAAHLAYVFVIGGDFMRGRFYLPILVGTVVLLTHLAAAHNLFTDRRAGCVATSLLAVIVIYSTAPCVQVFAALMTRLSQLVSGYSRPDTTAAVAPVALAVFIAASVSLGAVALRGSCHRRKAYLGCLILNGIFAAGLWLALTSRPAACITVAALLAASLTAGWPSKHSRAEILALTGVLAALVGSCCDLKPRSGAYRNTGVADEWTWHSTTQCTHPFAEPAEFKWVYSETMRDLGDLLQRYAERVGPVAFQTHVLGIVSVHAGTHNVAIDRCGLTDAFIAREYVPPTGRIGHPQFAIPLAYLQARGAINLLPDWRTRLADLDPTLCTDAQAMQAATTWPDADTYERYRLVQLVTTGPIFSRERLLALPRFIFPKRPPPPANAH